jgi:hypothetical protein
MQHGYGMQHGHGGSMDMACSMDMGMQHGQGHAAWALACSKDIGMQHGQGHAVLLKSQWKLAEVLEKFSGSALKNTECSGMF